MSTLTFLPGSLPTAPRPVQLAAACGPEGVRHWLPAGRVRALAGRAGKMSIRCLSGKVWLTQAGRADDILLTAGDVYECEGSGKIVAEALADAMLCAAEPRRSLDKR